MRRAATVLGLAAAACAQPKGVATEGAALHADGAFARPDPTVLGARLVPESLDLSHATVDAAGAARGMVHGVRFLSRSRGSVRTASERLDGLESVLSVPGRLGGGFLFTLGDTVYRTDDWLGDPRAVFRSSRPLGSLFAGLDRVYARTNTGHVALDPTTGALLDLGPWPAAPAVHAYFAFDGWRAVAVTDVRGLVATEDAGHRWDSLEVPLRPFALAPVHRQGQLWTMVGPDEDGSSIDAVVVSDGPIRPDEASPPGSRRVRCCIVTAAFEVSELATCDEVQWVLAGRAARSEAANWRLAPARPLRSALEDGWPLANGTAIVADLGALALVSLADGSVVDVTAHAYDPALGRCHAVPLGSAGPDTQPARSAFGFVCGRAAGRTALFTYDEASRRMHEVGSFAEPRVVQTSADGAWLVRGACSDAPTSEPASAVCVGRPSGSGYSWREVRVANVAGAAMGLCRGGQVAQVLPADSLGVVRLSITSEGGRETVLPLGFPSNAPEGFLARAVWIGSLDEREPGVLAGWLAAMGTVVGVQVQTDGTATTGPRIEELASPFVAGRYGLGWGRGHRAYETTDGGMTWTTFPAPTPLAPSDVRSCGPSGCVFEGWLRVGWGERTPAHARLAESPVLRRSFSAPIALTCEATEGFPPPIARPHERADPPTWDFARMPRLPRAGSLTPAYSRPESWFRSPAIAKGAASIHLDIGGVDASWRLGSLGRVDAWGPSRGDWTGAGRWEVRWRSPFSDPRSSVSSAPAAAPVADADAARSWLGVTRFGPASWYVVVGEDASHALLVAPRMPHVRRTPELFALDEGSKPTAVLGVDHAPWGDVEIKAALRVGDAWFVVAIDDADPEGLALFRADSAGTTFIGTVNRVASAPGAFVRLARGAAEDRLGILLDGEQLPDRATPRRWVVPVDVAAGRAEAPEPLGAADLSDRMSVSVCDDASGAGWVFDTKWPDANVRVMFGAMRDSVLLHDVFVRLRVSSDRGCLERLAGETSVTEIETASTTNDAAPMAPRQASDAGPTLPVALVSDGVHILRCEQRRK